LTHNRQLLTFTKLTIISKNLKVSSTMKKLIISAIVLFFVAAQLNAQNPKLQELLGKALGEMAAAKTLKDKQALINTFAQIADAEPTEWLPRYYVALNRTFMAYDLKDSDMGAAQELGKTALEEVKMAKKIAPIESELWVLEAYIYQLQLIEDPMSNGMKFTPMIYNTLKKAETLDPKNPRVNYIRGQFTLNMPEFYGGGAAKATPDIEKAAAKFAVFQPTSPVHPTWGAERNAEILKSLQVKVAPAATSNGQK
jgi:hypothetical protein